MHHSCLFHCSLFTDKVLDRNPSSFSNVRLFSPEELALYNGTDESRPILLGIIGRWIQSFCWKVLSLSTQKYMFLLCSDIDDLCFLWLAQTFCIKIIRIVVRVLRKWNSYHKDSPTQLYAICVLLMNQLVICFTPLIEG
ncbi:hypothetical protein K1719_012267 [Acacia pycnantha]|nr:hypothetical protein K1719_012267 [Acacia pycnantha]